jgi:hypothetical protein
MKAGFEGNQDSSGKLVSEQEVLTPAQIFHYHSLRSSLWQNRFRARVTAHDRGALKVKLLKKAICGVRAQANVCRQNVAMLKKTLHQPSSQALPLEFGINDDIAKV